MKVTVCAAVTSGALDQHLLQQRTQLVKVQLSGARSIVPIKEIIQPGLLANLLPILCRRDNRVAGPVPPMLSGDDASH